MISTGSLNDAHSEKRRLEKTTELISKVVEIITTKCQNATP
jgi:hypothetical protein